MKGKPLTIAILLTILFNGNDIRGHAFQDKGSTDMVVDSVETQEANLMDLEKEEMQETEESSQLFSTGQTVSDYQSLLAAIQNAPTNGEETFINISNHITLTGTVQIPSGRNIVIQSDENAEERFTLFNLSGRHFNISGHLTLKDIMVDGEGNTGGIYVSSGGQLTLEDGSIIENNLNRVGSNSGNNTNNSGGGVSIHGTLIMNGGSIRNNSANSGGGIYVYNNAKFEMNGGSIERNMAYDGGGIYNNGQVVIENGSINGNRVDYRGGGLLEQPNGSFTMNAGEIINNEASEGGGIYAHNPSALRSLEIGHDVWFENNRAEQVRIYNGNPSTAFPSIHFANVSVLIEGYIHPLNNYDIGNNQSTGVANVFSVRIHKVDLSGHFIGSTMGHGVQPNTMFDLQANLEWIADYEAVYYTIDGSDIKYTFDDLANLQILVNRSLEITVYHEYRGAEELIPHEVRLNKVKMDGTPLRPMSTHQVFSGEVFNILENLEILDNYAPQYYRITGDDTKYDLDEPQIIDDSLEITIYYASTILTVTFPEKIEFFVTAETQGDVISNEYRVINESELPVRVSFVELIPVELNGINLVSNAERENELHLNLEATLGFSYGVHNIDPNTEYGTLLGTLGASSSINDTGIIRLSGRYMGKIPPIPLRPQLEIIFSFELA